MMNLNNSFQYANYLDRLMDSASRCFYDQDVALNTVEYHKRSEVNPNAADFTKKIEKSSNTYEPAALINLMLVIVEERSKLTAAINIAKNSASFDMDAAIERAKAKRKAATAMADLLRFKPSTTQDRGTDYVFDIENKQSPYFYPIEVIKTENYDRKEVIASMKELLREADDLSTQIEKFQIGTEINFTPRFSVHDSLEDLL